MVPPLREDLILVPGPLDGQPTWTLHDPVRHRFFRIGRDELLMLNQWDQQKPTHPFTTFLQQNQLTQNTPSPPPPQGWLKTLLHHYLFFRLPLIHPDPLLERLLKKIGFLYTPQTHFFFWILTLATWFMTTRNWDRLRTTLPGFPTLEDTPYLLLAVAVAKMVHELGHALTAKRLGVSVPSMGVAFMVMWPVLYTELSESWKLTNRFQRISIAAAGIKAELGLAVLATFLWNLWPEGGFRNGLFLLATSTWIMTLALNISPFMRFDGYYFLSDLLEIPNLHARAFAMGRWWLRRTLLGLPLPTPEPWSPSKRRFLILFALATWCYRLLLFVGIALLVYHFFFKLLGLLLFAVEMSWFVLRPIGREGREWMRLMNKTPKAWARVVLLLLLLGALLLTPMWNHVEVAVMLKPERIAPIHPPEAARLETLLVQVGDSVEVGQPLARLISPVLEVEWRLSQAKKAVLHHRLERELASREHLADLEGLSRQLAQELVHLKGLEERRQHLMVSAPMAGRVIAIMDSLHPGQWLGMEAELITLASTGWQLAGYFREEELQGVAPTQVGRFYSQTPEIPPLKVRLLSLAQTGSSWLDLPELALVHGGTLPSKREADGRLVATIPLYRGVMTLEEPIPASIHRVHRGVVRLRGPRESLLVAMARQSMAVIIRESGF